MNNDEIIRELTDRFMAGETSLDEERQLYRYFAGGEVAEDLRPMRELFCSFAAMKSDEEIVAQRKPKPVRLPIRKVFVGVAASAAIMFAVGSLLWSPGRQDYCEAYVYNRHVTDPAQVMQEVDGTLQSLHQNDAAGVDSQLHDIFGTDQNKTETH